MRRGRLSFSADPVLTKEVLSPEVGGGASFVLYPIPGSARDARLLPYGSVWKSWVAWLRLERRLSSSFLQGTRPRFASGTLMSLRTIPPFRTEIAGDRVFQLDARVAAQRAALAPRLERAGAPSGSDIRVPSRVLSAAHATRR